MKKNKKIIIITITLIVILIIIFALKILNQEKQNRNNENNQNLNTVNEDNKNIINEIKEEINATGNTDIYEVENEYDGRKIIQIKSNVQFETALAGILKNSIFTEEEIQTLLKDKPTYNGIWISKNSREKFLKLLNENDINNYVIDDNGYLKLEESNNSEKEENKIIEKAMKSDNLYIINITGTSYIRDEISGEIVEYPFEKMDPYQILNTYKNGNATILEITTNEKNKASNKDILNEILQNIK